MRKEKKKRIEKISEWPRRASEAVVAPMMDGAPAAVVVFPSVRTELLKMLIITQQYESAVKGGPRCRGYGVVPHWARVNGARAADGPRSFAVWVLSSPACRPLCRAADHVSTHDNRHWPIHYLHPPAHGLSSGWWPDFDPHCQWNAASTYNFYSHFLPFWTRFRVV